MDNLSVLKKRNQLAENVLVRDRNSRHDDDARALHGLGHVVGGESDLRGSLSLVAEVAELRAA